MRLGACGRLGCKATGAVANKNSACGNYSEAEIGAGCWGGASRHVSHLLRAALGALLRLLPEPRAPLPRLGMLQHRAMPCLWPRRPAALVPASPAPSSPPLPAALAALLALASAMLAPPAAGTP